MSSDQVNHGLSWGARRRVALWLVFVLAVAYVSGFLLTHGHVSQYRYTDAWWRIAVANEYVRTGEFAKDPFFPGAPPMAQFGLLEFLNAKGKTWLGIDEERGYRLLVALGAVVFLVAGFVAGYWLRGNPLDGCVSSGVSWLICGRQGFAGIGIGFSVAAALLFVLMATFFSRFGAGRVVEPDRLFGGYRSCSRWGAIWRGGLLGVVTGLHVFVGLAGVVVSAVVFVWTVYEAARRRESEWGRELVKAGWFGCAFLVVCWPWLAMQAGLRPALAVVNAHVLSGYGIECKDILPLAGGVVVPLVYWVLARRPGRALSSLISVLVWGALVLFVCIPPVNAFVGRQTSTWMAVRIPLLFPYGLAAAHALPLIGGAVRRGGLWRVLAVCGVVLVLAGLAPLAARRALLHAYLVRTHDYDRHPYAYLRETVGTELQGMTVLSDPWASYYGRVLIGTYAVVVPPGHASPAVDYTFREAVARSALAGGARHLRGMSIDVVLIDKIHGATESFCGTNAEGIVSAWVSEGWHVTHETKNVVVLRPE